MFERLIAPLNWRKSSNTSQLLSWAVVLRVLLIVVGNSVDELSQVKYTDIDYDVYTDAARLVWDGKSPYEREGYRYPPLLAFLLLPNALFPSFGKVLFSAADLGILWQHVSIAKNEHSHHEPGVWLKALWLLNISFAVISTRVTLILLSSMLDAVTFVLKGSSDSIHNFLILSVLKLLYMKKHSVAGLLFGLAIHMRVYPIIFAPAFVLYIIKPEVKKRQSPSPSNLPRDDTSTKRVLSLCPPWIPTLLKVDPHMTIIEYSTSTALSALRFLWFCFLALFFSTSFSFFLYQWDFIENALLYHFERQDFRHNFSVHFYWLYLSDLIKPASAEFSWASDRASVLLSLLTFFPQVFLFTLITLSYARRNLPVCCLLLAYTLVAYNKVCTAQYFTWFACFIPTVAKFYWRMPLTKCFFLVLMWIASLLFWLKSAHGLEFCGENNFLLIWLASLAFHILNASCIVFVVSNSKSSKHVH